MVRVEDLHLKILIKNNLILARSKEIYGLISMRKLAEKIGVSYVSFLNYMSFKYSPVSSRNLRNSKTAQISTNLYWTQIAEKTAKALKCSPWEIFPEKFWPKRLSTFELEVDSQDYLVSFSDPKLLDYKTDLDPERLSLENERLNFLKESLQELTQREQLVFQLRYQNSQTLQEIADRFGCTNSRIGQIENKAIRKLRFKIRQKEK